MIVHITYTLSDKGRKAALALGLPAQAEQTARIEDPAGTLLEYVYVSLKGEAEIKLTGKDLRLKSNTEYFERTVTHTIYLPEIQEGGTPDTLHAPLTTLAEATAAVRAFHARKAQVLAALPALQAEEDAGFETRKAEYLAKETVRKAKAQAQAEAQEKIEAHKKAEQEKVRADRAAWILAEGSDYLKKAHEAGYNCQRVYVTDRAALEFPGYAVDFGDDAEFKDRACPSEAALDEALRVSGSVVWLTEPGADCRKAWDMEKYEDNYDQYGNDDQDGNDDPFTPCEAVSVKFLGKYDLLKTF